MRRDPRSTLTPGQQIIFDKFSRHPDAAITEDILPSVLRALEEQHRQTTQQLFVRSSATPPAGALLSAVEAAQLLAVNLNTFARSAARKVEALRVDGRTLYRRDDLVTWKDARWEAPQGTGARRR